MTELSMQRVVRRHIVECARYCEASLASAQAADVHGDPEMESYWRRCAARWSAAAFALGTFATRAETRP